MSMHINQQELAKVVLRSLEDPVLMPNGMAHISIERAQDIVDKTTEVVGRHGSDEEYNYLRAHRRRLAESLSWIPLASHENACCIDIGCFGYMAFWAQMYLGYREVEGIEYHPGRPYGRSLQSVTVDDATVGVTIHNFDIATSDWPISRTYDTVLFFETLEHVCTDPVGIMANIGQLMTTESTLVMSVPNCVSYKTLREFICGMPPWMYWFFHPDLSHEPRHCFEYTPFVLKTLLRASGFEETAFRTLYAFSDEMLLGAEQEIAKSLLINPLLFGDVILTVAKKIHSSPPIRYPSCIYDADLYYQEVWPILWPVLQQSILHFNEGCHPGNSVADVSEKARRVISEQESEINKLTEKLAQYEELANYSSNIGKTSDFSKESIQQATLFNPGHSQLLADKDIQILDLKRELGEMRRRFSETEKPRSSKKRIFRDLLMKLKLFLSGLLRG